MESQVVSYKTIRSVEKYWWFPEHMKEVIKTKTTFELPPAMLATGGDWKIDIYEHMKRSPNFAAPVQLNPPLYLCPNKSFRKVMDEGGPTALSCYCQLILSFPIHSNKVAVRKLSKPGYLTYPFKGGHLCIYATHLVLIYPGTDGPDYSSLLGPQWPKPLSTGSMFTVLQYAEKNLPSNILNSISSMPSHIEYEREIMPQVVKMVYERNLYEEIEMKHLPEVCSMFGLFEILQILIEDRTTLINSESLKRVNLPHFDTLREIDVDYLAFLAVLNDNQISFITILETYPSVLWAKCDQWYPLFSISGKSSNIMDFMIEFNKNNIFSVLSEILIEKFSENK